MSHSKIYQTLGNKALIIEGGAMRSVFSAGLLDAFIEQQFNPFDFNIGVSAGAYNLLTYLTGEQKKSLHIFEHFACRKDFINLLRFLRGGHLIDLDWLEKIAFDSSHINIQRAFQYHKPLIVCLTQVSSGKAIYIHTQPDNIKNVIKASAALPLLYRDFPIVNGHSMVDGGVADGIPVAEAIRLGAKNIMVIRARHHSYHKKDTRVHKFIRWKLTHHRQLLATMNRRIEIFQASLSLIRQPPEGIQIIEICPPADFNMKLLTRDKSSLLNGYLKGYNCADEAIKKWISQDNI